MIPTKIGSAESVARSIALARTRVRNRKRKRSPKLGDLPDVYYNGRLTIWVWDCPRCGETISIVQTEWSPGYRGYLCPACYVIEEAK